MNSDMSKRISARSLPNRNAASDRATSVLPTPVGPRKRNEPTGRPGAFKPARERRMARASAEIALSWLMMRLCSSSSMRRSLDISSSLMDVTGTPVQRATTSSMSSLRDHAHGGFVDVVLLAQQAEVLALLALLVGIEARLLKFVVGDGVFHAVDHELDALLHVDHLFGQGALAQLDARARFVDQVDGLVGQEAVGDVAVGVVDGGRAAPHRYR